MSKQALQIDFPGPPLQHRSAVPIYQQICEHIRSTIADGRLKPGVRLPATRVLATDWGVSRNVVLLAFEQLTLEGYLTSRTGSGTFVAPVPSPLPPVPRGSEPLTKQANLKTYNPFRLASEAYSLPHYAFEEEIRPFQTSLPSIQDFPFAIWGRLAGQVYRNLHRQHLGYGDAAGHWPLRQAIAEHVGVNRGVRCSPEQVVIVQGTQQALFLAGSLLLQPGDGFWMEDPGYMGAYATLQTVGGVACPVPVGAHGLDIDYALTQYPKARVAYVTPSHQFPMGGTLPYPARKCLLDWAERCDGWIIEDDYDSELRFCGRPMTSLQGLDEAGRVIYIGTFSKTLLPALRLGYVILPSLEVARLFTQGKVLIDRQGPLIEQLILAKFIQEGHYGRHLRRMQQLYETKQNWMLEALKRIPTEQGPLTSDVGMNLIIWLPEGTDDKAISNELAKQGVIASALSRYTFRHPKPPALVLGYAAFTKAQIEEATARLAKVLRAWY